MKYAFINNGVLQDVVMTRPTLLFAEGYASQFIEVPDECENGWTFDGETFSPPPAMTAERKALIMRRIRDDRLQACDWTQVADAPVDKDAWAAYRQALRDITTQPGFPWEFTWPIEPV